MRRLAMVLAAVSLGLAACGGSSGAPSGGSPTTAGSGSSGPQGQDVTADKAAAVAASLRLQDFPTGWTSSPSNSGPNVPTADSELAKCLGVPVSELNHKGPADYDSPDFSDADGNTVSDSISYAATLEKIHHQYSLFAGPNVPGCLTTALKSYLDYVIKHPQSPSDSLPSGVTLGQATVARMSFPNYGDATTGYRVTIPISAQGQTFDVNVDLIVLTKGRVGVELDFIGTTSPFPADQEQHYAQLVVSRLTRTT